MGQPDDDGGYLLANRADAAGRRFTAMAALFDPVSLRIVDRLGIGPGSRIWEVGAGGAALPSALAQRVGADGYVLATDIDTRWLPDGAGFDVRRHDLLADPPPEPGFDLVHARLVLVHLPDRQAALRTLIAATRPGGWVLVEDADPALQPLACPDEQGPPEELANRLRTGFRSLLAGRGAELGFGRMLPRLLRDAGLTEVGAEGFFPVTGPACAALELATVDHIRAQLLAHGLAGEAEIDQHLANVRAGTIDVTTAPLISAWGRRR